MERPFLSEQPFIIDAGEGMVRVVGTRFTVSTGADSVHVAVEEGVVEFFKAAAETTVTKPSEIVQLREGEQSYLTKATPVPEVSLIQEPESGRVLLHSFQFDGTSLKAVITEWEEKYGVSIELAPDLEACLLTAKITNEDIEGVLDILSTVFNVDITNSDQGIFIDGEGC